MVPYPCLTKTKKIDLFSRSASLGLAILASGSLAFAESMEAQKPNIVVIMADDAGYHDFGFQGNRSFEQITPNLDTLAERGTRFTHAYVTASVCGPSRAGFITGKYQQRFGFQENFPPHWGDPPHHNWRSDAWRDFGLDTNIDTMADYLRRQGYRTGIVGKWHLGYSPQFYPNERGFDYFFGFRTGARSYFSQPEYNTTEVIPNKWNSLEENGVIIPDELVTYLTDDLTDKALAFLEEAHAMGKPYFLFLSHLAPHTPMQATQEDLAIAKEKFPDEVIRRQTYTAMMLNMDRNIGRVIEKIEAQGQTDNTIIVFLSDNGGARNNASNNYPLRHNKFSPFEGGVRVPMLLSWPGTLPEGYVFDGVVSSLDLLPTFLEAAHHEIVEGLDGLSLIPWLKSRDQENFPQRDLFWREDTFFGATEWMRSQQDEKVIWYVGTPPSWGEERPDFPSLFNLNEDPREAKDLGPHSRERIEKLRERYENWATRLIAPRWPVN